MNEKNDNGFFDSFLDGNDLIENAISNLYGEESDENFIGILESIRQRMHEDGHFIFPVIINDEDNSQFSFHTIRTNDGKTWNAAFTSHAEYEKGEPANVISYFIDSAMKNIMEFDTEGLIINPWGQSFFLTKQMIEKIFEADGDVEYSVPEDTITRELLEDGSFLKRATGICSRNQTTLNMFKLARILRDSYVWVPCNAILSDSDQKRIQEMIDGNKDDLSALKGEMWQSMDEIRQVPDILQNGDKYYFPIFTSADEMGEYGENFSKIESHFLQAMNLARNNEKNVEGIVINAFTEPVVVPIAMFDIIAGMDSSIDKTEDEKNG